MSKPLTAIVIGAGLSGLSCASQLVKACHRVLVLEARDRIGGRTHTLEVEALEGTPMDLGASFIHGLAGNPLYTLTKQHHLAIYRAKPDDQQKSHIYSPSGPPLDDEVAARLGHNSLLTIFGTSAAFAQDRPDGVPAPTESLADYVLDEATSTLFQGLKSSVEKGYARQMAESWDGWMGAQLSDVSLRYWQSDVTYRGPDATIVDGYRGIYQRLAEVVNHDSTNNGSTIRLNEEIVAIRLSEDGDAITVETRDVEHKEHNPAHNGETSGQTRTYTAPYCVCTLPLGVLQQRPPRFQPPLPKRRLDATRRLGMGLLNKIIVTYPSCFWPEKESFLSFLPSKASTEFLPILASRALFAQNYLPITGKNTLVFYCGAAFGSELEKKTDEEVAQGIHKILAFHFNKDGIDGGSKKVSATSTPATRLPDKPDSIIVTRWESDPYSCGSYSFVRPSRKHDTDLPTPYDFAELARPVWGDRLFFAGEATDPDHYATAHGALMTGQREAQHVLDVIEAESLEA